MKGSEKNRGAAMIIVLCVMVVFLALSTTVILAGSVALNTARTNVIYERGKVQASSLSELFVGDLVDRDITEESSTLLRYVRDEIMGHSWPAYDEEKDADEQLDGAVRTFTLDTGEESDGTHQISIEMYWTWDDNATVSWDAIEENSLGSNKLHLFVDVICTLNETNQYHVKREFNLNSVLEITGAALEAEYKYKWNWIAVGRNPDRGKDGGA